MVSISNRLPQTACSILLAFLIPSMCNAVILTQDSDLESMILGKKAITLEGYSKNDLIGISSSTKATSSFLRQGEEDKNVVKSFTETTGRRRHLTQIETNCTLWRVEVRYEDFEEGHWECEFTDPDLLDAIDAQTRDHIIVGDGIEDFINSQGAMSGKSIMILSPGVEVTSDNHELFVEQDQIVSVAAVKAAGGDRQGRRGLASTLGELRTLVVRLNYLDASPPSAQQLSSDIFGDTYCLKQQYNRCSYGQMTIDPATGFASSAIGVLDVTVQSPVGAKSRSDLQFDANVAARSFFGLTVTQGLQSQFDLVLFCQPPNPQNSNWLAYAFLNRWDSYYNDFWCQSLSAQMHEVGHNLGLEHSGEKFGSTNNQIYGDVSGMMGFSFNEDEGPIQCFNPAKNWQLGWYDEKVLDFNARFELKSGPKTFKLNGIVDYQNGKTGRYIIIKIGRYYIGWNKKASFNAGTREAADLVTVTEKLGRPYETAESKLLGRLDIGGEYVIGEENVVVKYIKNDSFEDAIIELSFANEIEYPCDAELNVVLKTDMYPQETIWGVVNLNNDILYVSDGYTQQMRTYTETVFGLCEEQDYIFVILDRGNDGLCCQYGQGGFVASSRGDDLLSGGVFGDRFQSVFRIPAATSPTASPTVNPTKNPTINPTENPTVTPTKVPTPFPTTNPTSNPTKAPTAPPVTGAPTANPTANPTKAPTAFPTANPTKAPTAPPVSGAPTANPTATPTKAPTAPPVSGAPTANPTGTPTKAPTAPPVSGAPTANPTANPTKAPTAPPVSGAPTANPTGTPTKAPTAPPVSGAPTANPTANPTKAPTAPPVSGAPTANPTANPTKAPTAPPVSGAPTANPTANPTKAPTAPPVSGAPTANPTGTPTKAPTAFPTANPTKAPTIDDATTEPPSTANPTANPTKAPTAPPVSEAPTVNPTANPTKGPTAFPTANPTKAPTAPPVSGAPTANPTNTPTKAPTAPPVSGAPTANPTNTPTKAPTSPPVTGAPTANPTATPTSNPTANPTGAPTFPTVNDQCTDDKSFLWKGRRGKTCNWIARRRNTGKICKKWAFKKPRKGRRVDKTRVKDYCKKTCSDAGINGIEGC